MKIISGILILITAFLSFRHGWAGFTMNPEQSATLMSELGINQTILHMISGVTFVVGILVLFPATFFLANIINAILFILIMAFQLNAGNYNAALIEIPFLLISFLMMYMGHPLRKSPDKNKLNHAGSNTR